MSDGRIVIDTKLSNDGIKKDIQDITKQVGNVGKNIADSMNKAEKSINNVGKSFKGMDFSKVVSQLGKVSDSIEKTNSKIDTQKQKLEKLKTAYEKAGTVKQKDNISAQMEKTEQSITKLESKLTGLNNKKLSLEGYKSSINGLDGEFKSASVSIDKSLDTIETKAKSTARSMKSSFDGLGEGFTKAGSKISSVGDTLNRNVTLPVLAAGVAAAKVGMDFDSGMSRVKAISGATGEEFTKLHDQALKLGGDTAFSAKQAAEGMENLASAGFNTNEIMKAMPGMLDLAASSGEDLATSADIAASTLNGFGLAADQAGHVADVLAKNASATNAAVKDTGEAMKYIAPVAQEAGWSLESVTAAIGEMANNGIKGSTSGTTLRSMFTSLVKPSDEAAKAMETMGFKAYDSNNKMKSLSELISDLSKSTANMTDEQKENTIATLFGQEAMSGILTLIKQGSSGLDTLTDSYKNADGAASDMAKTMQDNSKASIEQMFGSLETAAIKIEEDFAPTIIKIAKEVGDLADKFAELSPEQQEFYVKMALGVAAASPLLKTIGGISTGIGGIIKIGGGLASMFSTTAVAEGTLSEGGGVLTGVLGGLGVAASSVIAVLAALGVAVGGVVTYNELMSKSVDTSTDDLNAWEKLINDITGNTIKSKEELQATGLAYKDFGDNLDDNFKKKVEDSTKAIGEFSMFLSNINFDEVLSDSETSQFNEKIDSMCDEAIKSIKSRQAEAQQEMTKFFDGDDNFLDDTEKATLQALSQQGEEQMKIVQDDQKSIHEIYTNAIKERGHLTEDEKKAIKDRYIEISQIELEASQEAQSKQAQSYLKHDFANRANNLSDKDASALLKEQKGKLDEQRVKNSTDYDVNLDRLKELLATQSGVEAEATQKEIDKFTEKKDKISELEQQQWEECIATIERENPKLVGTLNKYTGDILSNKDKEKNETLKKMEETYTGLTGITESGMYSLKDVTTGTFEDVYVAVDGTSKDIVAAYGQASGRMGGYTEAMAKDAHNSALEMTLAYTKVQQSLDTTAEASVNASGQLIDDNNNVIAQLGELQTEADGTTYRILNLNGTPIKIETNSDGTVKDLDSVREAADNVPSSKKIETSSNAPETAGDVSNLKDQVNTVPETHTTVFQAILRGFDEAAQAVSNAMHTGGAISFSAGNSYVGNDNLQAGMTFINEHGWELAKENNISLLGDDLALLSGGGGGISDHMTSENEMRQAVASQVGSAMSQFINTLARALGSQTNLLGQVASNTSEIKKNGDSAQALINNLKNNTTGTFSNLQGQISTADELKQKADRMKIEDNTWYAQSKAKLDDVQSQIDSVKDQIDNTEDEATKKDLQAQQKVLEKQKDTLDKEVDYYKDAAQQEIEVCKANAEAQVKVAEEKKEKLTKIADAITEAIKTKLEEEKAAAEKVLNDEMSNLEEEYNKKVAALEKDEQEDSRNDERKAAKDNIKTLTTKMNNTASVADKRAYALQIKDAKKELSDKEDEWNLEDKKKALEEEYNEQKEKYEEQLKDTDDYYDKLMETDSINAQARYLLLNSNNDELVKLLESYNPKWQDAGQSLADSLLLGLNSQKQSIQDAVTEMVDLRSGTTENVPVQSLSGYATGTTYNSSAGLYNVDEQGFELSSSGNVAYVSQGAAIKNHMQSEQYISAEIAKQVALMKASIEAEQLSMKALLVGSLARSSNNNSVTNNDNGLTLAIENFNNYRHSDVEQLGNELDSVRKRNKLY